MAFHIFSRALLSGQPIEIYGDGEQSREFTYVDDAVRAVMLAAEKGAPGSVYNIGGGNEITLNEAIQMLMQISGREVPLHYGEKQPGDARRTAADASLTHRELGYEPEVDLEQGLRAEFGWLESLLGLPVARES